MAPWCEVVPLTAFQRHLLASLAASPNADRYLAGEAALHFEPHSTRYSDDLDFFHDSEARVASTFGADRAHLEGSGYTLEVEQALPGFVRATVRKGEAETRVDWAHLSAWRFMPLVREDLGGWLLHPVDLAVNKVLALAGRDEARDFVDMMFIHRTVLPLAGLAWAAVGKDPGFSPGSLLELLKRRGRHRQEEFARLHLAEPFDLRENKARWLAALEEAEAFPESRPAEEVGCLYLSTDVHRLSTDVHRFVLPRPEVTLDAQHIVLHFGAPGGVVPRVQGPIA